MTKLSLLGDRGINRASSGTAARLRSLGDHDAYADGPYRYVLIRRWGPGPLIVFVLLNPSIADAVDDDPTVRKCIGYARRLGAGGIVIVNMFAWRATDPRALKAAWRAGHDVVGPLNESIVLHAVSGRIWPVSHVIAGWGSHAAKGLRNAVDPAFVQRIVTVATDVWCLRTTVDGQPWHPLYLPYSAEPFIWRAAA